MWNSYLSGFRQKYFLWASHRRWHCQGSLVPAACLCRLIPEDSYLLSLESRDWACQSHQPIFDLREMSHDIGIMQDSLAISLFFSYCTSIDASLGFPFKEQKSYMLGMKATICHRKSQSEKNQLFLISPSLPNPLSKTISVTTLCLYSHKCTRPPTVTENTHIYIYVHTCPHSKYRLLFSSCIFLHQLSFFNKHISYRFFNRGIIFTDKYTKID